MALHSGPLYCTGILETPGLLATLFVRPSLVGPEPTTFNCNFKLQLNSGSAADLLNLVSLRVWLLMMEGRKMLTRTRRYALRPIQEQVPPVCGTPESSAGESGNWLFGRHFGVLLVAAPQHSLIILVTSHCSRTHHNTHCMQLTQLTGTSTSATCHGVFATNRCGRFTSISYGSTSTCIQPGSNHPRYCGPQTW